MENIKAEGDAKADAHDKVKLQGAGPAFPRLYSKWFKDYQAAHPEVEVDYQSLGSTAGIKTVVDKTGDFSRRDAAMSKEDMEKVDGGVQLLPMTAGSIVLAYNLPGVDNLKLTRDAYVSISSARSRIGMTRRLPTPIQRQACRSRHQRRCASDGSGTTYVFTKHLSAISDEFAKNSGPTSSPTGLSAARPRATKALPRQSNPPRARSAISNMAMPETRSNRDSTCREHVHDLTAADNLREVLRRLLPNRQAIRLPGSRSRWSCSSSMRSPCRRGLPCKSTG